MRTDNKNSFFETETAKSTPEKLWLIYTDLKNWKIWDTELENSYLEGEFINNSIGKLKSKGSPEVKFVLTNVEPNKRFVSKSDIPFGKLIIDHLIEQNGDTIKFTHFVQFTGPLAGIFNFLLGRGFKKALPKVLQNLKQQLENQNI